MLIKNIAFLTSFLSSFVLATNEPLTLKIEKLTDNVYQHISYQEIAPYGKVAASGLVVIKGNNAHIIDTPWSISDSQQLINWINEQNFTLKTAVITHFHQDASAGLPLLNSLSIKSYATPLTNQLLRSKGREITSDEITTDTFQHTENTIEIFYPGAGHSRDNIVIWLPNEKILFAGCFIKSLNSKHLGNISDASITEWPNSINNILAKYPDIKMVIPGHGQPGDSNLLFHTQKLISKTKTLTH